MPIPCLALAAPKVTVPVPGAVTPVKPLETADTSKAAVKERAALIAIVFKPSLPMLSADWLAGVAALYLQTIEITAVHWRRQTIVSFVFLLVNRNVGRQNIPFNLNTYVNDINSTIRWQTLIGFSQSLSLGFR